MGEGTSIPFFTGDPLKEGQSHPRAKVGKDERYEPLDATGRPAFS